MIKYNRPFGECLKCPIGIRYCNDKTKWVSCEIKAHYFVKGQASVKTYINLINNQFYGKIRKYQGNSA
jgi:hypothetical protein